MRTSIMMHPAHNSKWAKLKARFYITDNLKVYWLDIQADNMCLQFAQVTPAQALELAAEITATATELLEREASHE